MTPEWDVLNDRICDSWESLDFSAEYELSFLDDPEFIVSIRRYDSDELLWVEIKRADLSKDEIEAVLKQLVNADYMSQILE